MALEITELFGYAARDSSSTARTQVESEICPFTSRSCWKKFRSNNVTSGTCAVKPTTGQEVICCPDRLYGNDYRVLRELILEIFGPTSQLVKPSDVLATQGQNNRIVAFGKRWGKELRVPKNSADKGGYSADWILAKITDTGDLEEFIPVEVQSMDTTGSYQREWCELTGNTLPSNCQPTSPDINWENVNKRIIPQLLTKGNIFQREALCRKGLFFICPTAVYKRLLDRLGTTLTEYPIQSGALTFRHYALEDSFTPGTRRSLELKGKFTTLVQNLRDAFNTTLNLPSQSIMTQTIRKALQNTLTPPKPKKAAVKS